MSLKYRIAVTIFLLEVVMVAIVLRQGTLGTMESATRHVQRMNVAIVDLMEEASRPALLTQEYSMLGPFFGRIAEQEFVTAALLADREGVVVASIDLSDLGSLLPSFRDDSSSRWMAREVRGASGLLGTVAVRFSDERLLTEGRQVRDRAIGLAALGMGLIAIVGILSGYLLTIRLDRLAVMADQLADGNTAARSHVRGRDEIGRVGEAFDRMAGVLHEEQQRLRMLNQSLEATRSELLEMNAQLESLVNERTEQLVAANEELESFAYSVAHDLKAPLRAIDGYSGMLEESLGSSLPEDAQRLLDVVRENTQRMGHLIEDLLEFSRVGRTEMSISDVNMRELVEAVFSDLMRLEGDRTVEFSVARLPTVPADLGLVRQVWMNLLQNALKFSRGRELTRIEVDHWDEPDHWVFRVRDNGAGFDMTYVDKLFGVFQRLHYQDEFPGSGVGLATVQRIVQRHGGEVWAEAEVDEGASIFFRLPRGSEAT